MSIIKNEILRLEKLGYTRKEEFDSVEENYNEYYMESANVTKVIIADKINRNITTKEVEHTLLETLKKLNIKGSMGLYKRILKYLDNGFIRVKKFEKTGLFIDVYYFSKEEYSIKILHDRYNKTTEISKLSYTISQSNSENKNKSNTLNNLKESNEIEKKEVKKVKIKYDYNRMQTKREIISILY